MTLRCPFLHNDEWLEFETMRELGIHLQDNHNVAAPFKLAETIAKEQEEYIPVSKIEEKIKQYENIHYNKPNPEWIIRIEELKSLLPKK